MECHPLLCLIGVATVSCITWNQVTNMATTTTTKLHESFILKIQHLQSALLENGKKKTKLVATSSALHFIVSAVELFK